MATDPIIRIARQRIIKISADLEVQLRGIASGTVHGRDLSIEILRRLRMRAAESLAALAVANPENPFEIRTLQNQVMKYDEWLGWLKEIISEGVIYDAEIGDEEREELLDLLTQTPEGMREAVELGLIDPNTRDD